MEQNLDSFQYFPKEYEEKLRTLSPINRLFYMCLAASKLEDGTGEMCSISSDVSDLIYQLRETYSLNDYSKIIKNQCVLINRNDDLLTASPLLIGFETWKEIMKYELSLISFSEREQELKKILGALKDLSFRINNDHIFNVFDLLLSLDHVSKFSEKEFDSDLTSWHSEPIDSFDLNHPNLIEDFLDEEGHYYLQSLDKVVYDIPIKRYSDFLKTIDLLALKTEDPKEVLRRIQEQNNRDNERIHLNKSPNKVINGLKYLLSKIYPEKEKSELDQFSTQIVDSIFDTENYPSQESFPGLEIENHILVDYLIFLEKNDYIKTEKMKTSLQKVLSRHIKFNLKGGGSYPTFKRLYYDRTPESGNILDYKPTFGNLTSEITLKNEMIH